MTQKAVPSFNITRDSDLNKPTLIDRVDKERFKKQDIRLERRHEDSHGKDKLTIAIYVRDSSLEAGRYEAHYEEVFKVLHAETSDVIHVKDTKGGDPVQYPKAYIQTCYDVFVLGKFRKGSPEVEELLATETKGDSHEYQQA